MSSETVARSTDAFFTTRAQRLEDLPLLVECFRARHAERFGIDSVCFEPQLLDALASRPWPGNVRELENVVQRLLALSDEGRVGPEALEQSAAPAPHSLRERLESLSAKYWRRRWTKPATTTHRAPGGWASPEPRSWTN